MIGALEQHAREQRYSWYPIIHHGKKAWEFQANAERWIIEPQVSLGTAQHVSAPSKADFVCWPVAGANANRRPVAIFTDGFAYHARPTELHGAVADDVQKRAAIVASDQLNVWSVTWEDVKEFEEQTPFSLHLYHQQQRTFDRVIQEARSSIIGRHCARTPSPNCWNICVIPIDWAGFRPSVAWSSPVCCRCDRPCPKRPSHAWPTPCETQAATPELSLPDTIEPGHQLYSIVEQGALRQSIQVPDDQSARSTSVEHHAAP